MIVKLLPLLEVKAHGSVRKMITKISIQCYYLAGKSACENVLQIFKMSDNRKYMSAVQSAEFKSQ